MTTERDLTRLELLDEVERIDDQYLEVARALGCTSFFHGDVLARARECKAAHDYFHGRSYVGAL
jgi:hypothetical protein